jgi:enoyl-CoA hydratase/carnithine racemase
MESLGAGLLAASNIPTVYDTAEVSFPEASQYGFVPLGGSTYFLSRLPDEFGTFLALTGQIINGPDIVYANFAERVAGDEGLTIEEILGRLPKINKMMKRPRLDHLYLSVEMEKERVARMIELRQKEDHQRYLNELAGLKQKDEWVSRPNPWARLEKKARDLLFMKYDNNAKGEVQEFERAMRSNNHFESMMITAKAMLPGETTGRLTSLGAEFPIIRRCFYPDSVQGIMELLRKDGTEFADRCLRTMEQASPLALELTLRLLREARSKGYAEAMAQELGVAINRATDSEFPIILEQRVLASTPNMGNIWKYQGPIPESLIQQYMAAPTWVSTKTVEMAENALLPVREFYQYFPDALRLWLHGEEPGSEIQLANFRDNLIAQLQDLGVDIRDSSVSPEVVRKDLQKSLQSQRKNLEQINRIMELHKDEVMRKKYLDERKGLIDKMCENDEVYYKEIHKRIEDIFQTFYTARMDVIKSASNNAHKIVKHRFLLRLKQFLLENRILLTTAQKDEIAKNKVNALRYQVEYLPGDPTKTYKSHGHRAVKQTFIFYVAQALKKESQLYPKLLSYFAYPETPKRFVKWLLDVPSLEKLKKRLQEDEVLLVKLQRFYSLSPTYESKWYQEFFEDYARVNYPNKNPDHFRSYEAYMRIKKKAEDLEHNLKEVLLKQLEELITVA